MRRDDRAWADIVRWVLFAMIIGEEKGLSSRTVDKLMEQSDDREVRRILGLDGDFGALLGLDEAWAYHVIKLVGNYGEAYDRHLGPETAMGLPRGVNRPWTRGGLLFAPPFR